VLTVLLPLAAGIVGHVASAVDTAILTAGRPRWAFVLIGWGALIAGSLVLDPLRDNYRAHYAQAFTIPSGAMMDTLLPNDYILVDKSVYRTREPQRDDVVLFRADTSCRYAHGCDLTTVPPDS